MVAEHYPQENGRHMRKSLKLREHHGDRQPNTKIHARPPVAASVTGVDVNMPIDDTAIEGDTMIRVRMRPSRGTRP